MVLWKSLKSRLRIDLSKEKNNEFSWALFKSQHLFVKMSIAAKEESRNFYPHIKLYEKSKIDHH